MKKTDAEKYLASVKRRPAKNESTLQRAIVKWCNGLGYASVKDRFFAVPNGWGISGSDRKSAMIQGARLKAEGVKSGVPDLVFFRSFDRADAIWPAVLFVEVKLGTTGKLSARQESFHQLLKADSHSVVVVRDLTDAIKAIVAFYAAR
jgi:hypothetical protein